MTKKTDWKRILSTALFIVLVALLCWYVYQNRADMKKLLELDVKTVSLLLMLAFFGCVMNCVYHRIILSTYHIPLSIVDWMGVVFVSNAMAYVLPLRADLVFTAAYYKRTKGLAYVKSVSMAAGNIIFGVAFALLQMLAALLCTGFIDGLWPATLWIVWSVAVVLVAVFILFSLLFQSKLPAWLSRHKLVMDVVSGFNALIKNKTLLWQLLVCMLLNNIVHLLLYMVCFHAMGLDVTVYQALFYNSVSRITSMVAIVPGNIGIREAIMGVATSLMGALFQSGVAVSLLQRVSLMVVYIVVGGLFAFPVWRKWNKGQGLADTQDAIK